MRVERCPSCGARYNVTRLATGSRFSCRRCGAAVQVGALDGIPSGPSRRPGLVIVAVLGLATIVLHGFRSFDLAADSEPPWVVGGLTLQEIVLFGVAGLTCVFAGLVGLRMRPLLLLAAATTLFWILIPVLHPSIHDPATDPAAFLGLALVAAAALLLAAPPREGQTAARALALVGAGLLVATLAAHPLAGLDETRTVLTSLTADVATFWRDVVWRGEAAPIGLAPWAHEIPWTARALAVLSTLLAAAVSLGGARGLARFLARAGVVLILAAALAPPLASAWAQRDALLGAAGPRLASGLVIGAAWDPAGIVPGLLAAYLLGAFAELRAVSRRSIPTTPRPASGLSHAALAVLAAVTVLLLENPGFGVLSTRWPWDEALSGIASAASATALCLGTLVATATLACLVPPMRRGGTLVAFGAALAAGTSDLRFRQFGVPAFMIPCVLAAGAGLLWARRGAPRVAGTRAILATLAIALFGLLLWPEGLLAFVHDVNDLVWISAATQLADTVSTIGDARGPSWAALVLAPTAIVTLAALAGIVFVLASIAGPRRGLAWIAALLAGIIVVHPLVERFVRALTYEGSAGTDVLVEAGKAASRALLHHPAAVVWATFVVTAEAAAIPRAPTVVVPETEPTAETRSPGTLRSVSRRAPATSMGSPPPS